MTKTTNGRVARDCAIYIEFHSPVVEDFIQNKEQIENKLNAVFNDSFELVYSVEGSHDLVYEVTRPVLDDGVVVTDFFKALQFVFDSLAEFTPHFTKIEGEAINGN